MVRESKSALSPENLLQKVLDQAFVISDAPGGKPYTLEDLEKGNIKVKFVGQEVHKNYAISFSIF